MRGGGSGSGVAGAGPETGSGLTGAGAAGSAVAIDAVRIGAASWTRLASCEAGSGAETGDGLAGGSAVAIEAVRVGAASRTSDLVLRRSWTRTPAASAASSVMGTMSIDFIAMGIHRHQETVIDLAERVLTMCFTPHFSSSTRTRWSRADPGSPGVFGVSRHQASSFETKRFDVGALARGHGTIFELPRRPKSTGGGESLRAGRYAHRRTSCTARARGMCLGCRLSHYRQSVLGPWGPQQECFVFGASPTRFGNCRPQ
jgi:hypothetical protein